MAEGFKIADAYVEVEAEIDRESIRSSAKDAGASAGTLLGDELAGKADARIRDSRPRFVRTGESSGEAIGRSMGDSAGRTVGNVLAGHLPTIFSNPYVLGAATAAGVVLAPALAAGISGGILGGAGIGVIAGGIALVAKDARIVAAANDLRTSLFDIDTSANEKKLEVWRAKLLAARKAGNAEAIAEARRNVKALETDIQQATAFNAKNTSLKDMAGVFIKPTVKALETFEAAIDRIKPKIGSMFDNLAGSGAIESLATGITSLVENALPGFEKMIEASGPFLKSLGPGLGELGKGLGSFFASIGSTGPDAAIFFGDLLRWLSGVISVGGAVLAWLSSAYVSMRNFFTSIPGWIGAAKDTVVGWWDALWQKGVAAVNWISALPGRVGGYIAGIASQVAARGAQVLAWFQALPGKIGSFLATLPGRAGSAITRMFDLVTTGIGVGIGLAVRFMATFPGKVVSAISSLGSKMRTVISSAWSTAKANFSSGVEAVVGFARSLPGKIYNAAIGLVAKIRGVFSSAKSTASSTASSLVSSVISTLRSLPGRAGSAVAGVAGAIASKLRGAVGSARSIGADIIRGVIGGINSMIGAAVGAAKRAVGNIVSGAKSALGISSPSKVMADQVGRWMLPGLTAGMERTVPAAKRSVGAAVRSLVPPVPAGTVSPGTGLPGGSPGSPVYNFAPGSIVIDASSLRSIADLLAMINGLQTTARAMRPRATTVGA